LLEEIQKRRGGSLSPEMQQGEKVIYLSTQNPFDPKVFYLKKKRILHKSTTAVKVFIVYLRFSNVFCLVRFFLGSICFTVDGEI